MKVNSLILLLCLMVGVSEAYAQTLVAPASSSKNQVQNQQSIGNIRTNIQDTTEDEVAEEQEQDNPYVEDAVFKSEAKAKEPVYDNTYGSVHRFKIVQGKVVMMDNIERNILIYYSNFRVSKGMDGIVRCSMRINVLNDLTDRINTLGFKLIWPQISTSLHLSKLNPGVNTYSDITLLGDGCFTMDKVPVVEINRCRLKGMSEEQCADKVKWFRTGK